MAVVQIQSAVVYAGQVVPVTVEADLKRSLPSFQIIGMANQVVREARERVRLAIRNLGFTFPSGRLTINLLPSSLPKQSSLLDLAVAYAILVVSEQVSPRCLSEWFLGELGLAGNVNTSQQILPILIEARRQQQGVVIGKSLISYAQAVGGIKVITVDKLVNFDQPVKLPEPIPHPVKEQAYLIDQLRGLESVKRAVLIALAGKHRLFLLGPAGTGKSVLAQAAVQLLPPLTQLDRIEYLHLSSLANRRIDLDDWRRPFVALHSQTTERNFFGGGVQLRPGELSLGSTGLVFMDEFAEWDRQVRESLRQPMAENVVRLTSPFGQVDYPVPALLWAAQNPCPCGRLGVPNKRCSCLPQQVRRYSQALSEPIKDRFEMYIWVSTPESADWSAQPTEQQGRKLADQIEKLWSSPQKNLTMDPGAKALLIQAYERFQFSPRRLFSLERVAQTIALVDQKQSIDQEAVLEALQYRYQTNE